METSPRRSVALERSPWLVVVAFAVVGAFVALWFPHSARVAALAALRHKAETQARLISYSIAPAIDFGDADAVREAFRGAERDVDFVGVEALGVDGREIAHAGSAEEGEARVLVELPIEIAGRGDATLRLVLSTARIDAQSREQRLVGAGIGVTIVLLGVGIALWIARSIRRITDLLEENARERARAEQASEVKSRFLANMSHEMRTPLNGVLGLADVLSRRSLDTTTSSLVRSIARSGRTLLSLVNDILDLSRVESGQLELERAPFDPEGAGQAVCEMLLPLARTKGVDLVLSVSAGVPRRVVGDGLRFEQILTNLVGNAVKFTSKGHVIVSLSHGAGRLEARVADTGAGIPPDKLDSIFDAFSQADTSTTRRFGGSGLGLTIARRLARKMGGDLEVSSEVGVGSTFVFSAPLSPSEPALDATSARDPSGRLPALETAAHGSPALVVCEAEATRGALVEHATRAGLAPRVVGVTDVADVVAASSAGRGLAGYVIWDARVAGSDAARAALDEATRQRGWRVLVHAALGDDAPLPGVPCSVLLQPFSRDTFARALARHPSADGTPDARGAPTSVPRLRARVLVAEDDETNRLVLESFARELGIDTELVTDGLEAVRRVTESESFDVVLMDCQMPRLDGYEATRRIRAFEVGAGRTPVPIVAVTAHALPAERARAVAAGMNGYLTKPLSLESLRATLLEHVHGRAVPRESTPPAEELSNARRIKDRATLEKLRDSYRRGSDEALLGIADALGVADWAAVSRHAHKLKGSSATLGAKAARELAARLETLARAGGSDDATAILVELEVAIADAQESLDALVQERSV